MKNERKKERKKKERKKERKKEKKERKKEKANKAYHMISLIADNILLCQFHYHYQFKEPIFEISCKHDWLGRIKHAKSKWYRCIMYIGAIPLIKGGSVAWICADTCFVLQYQSCIFIVEFPYAKRRHAVT